jgi:hypothetical protein
LLYTQAASAIGVTHVLAGAVASLDISTSVQAPTRFMPINLPAPFDWASAAAIVMESMNSDTSFNMSPSPDQVLFGDDGGDPLVGDGAELATGTTALYESPGNSGAEDNDYATGDMLELMADLVFGSWGDQNDSESCRIT